MTLQTDMTPIPVEPTPSRVNPDAITVEILDFDAQRRTIDVRVTDHGGFLFQNAISAPVTGTMLNITELRRRIAFLVESRRIGG